MTLYTASINTKRTEEQGVRVSVMRFHRSYYSWDIWAKSLAPTKELLLSYKDEQTSWQEYVPIYLSETLEPNRQTLEAIAYTALHRDITLLCWEKMPEMCHRRLIAEACQEFLPELELVVR